jgi:hypothetical protein
MNLPIGIIDENGSIKTIIINKKFLVELSEKLRIEGVTPVHTSDDNGSTKTYNVQAIVLMAKGCKGHMMFIPNKD